MTRLSDLQTNFKMEVAATNIHRSVASGWKPYSNIAFQQLLLLPEICRCRIMKGKNDGDTFH